LILLFTIQSVALLLFFINSSSFASGPMLSLMTSHGWTPALIYNVSSSRQWNIKLMDTPSTYAYTLNSTGTKGNATVTRNSSKEHGEPDELEAKMIVISAFMWEFPDADNPKRTVSTDALAEQFIEKSFAR